MTFETLTIKQKVALTINAASGTNPITLIDYVPYSKAGYRLINESIEINNLRFSSWIYSLDTIEFPVFEVEDSESKQLLTAINLEWDSPRIELDLLIKIEAGNWQKFAAYSLINPSPYPYREYTIGNHLIGNNSILGVQIIDVGFGGLITTDSSQDKVVIFGDVTREVILEKFADNGSKVTNNITTTASIIVPSNSSRTNLLIFNSSTKDIFIDIVSSVSTSSHLVKVEVGDYYEAPLPIYTGAYYAVVASGSAVIDIREFV